MTISSLPARIASSLAALFIAGCAADAPPAAVAAEALVSTNLSSYTVGDDVVVTWDGLAGTSTDWIGIGWPSLPCSSVGVWQYTGGATSGSMTFHAIGAGTWDARAYNNNSSSCAFRSSSFVVNPPGAASVTTDDTSYGYDEDVVVSWTNLPGNLYDWVAIAPQGSSNTTYTAWWYTNSWSGVHTHTAVVGSGWWVARAFANNGFTLLDQSEPFYVAAAGAPAISVGASTYEVGDPITVTWSNMPGVYYDVVTIAHPGTPASYSWLWAYMQTAVNGSRTWTFSTTPILPPGTYEARAYRDDNTYLASSAAFEVTAGDWETILHVDPRIPEGASVAVSYEGMPGYGSDFLYVAAEGTPANTTPVASQWLGAATTTGSVTFAPMALGRYEARVLFNWNGNPVYTIRAMTPFEVVDVWRTFSSYPRTGGYAVSRDGRFVAGYGRGSTGSTRTAVRMPLFSGSTVSLGDLTGGVDDDVAYGIDGDGDVVVGFASGTSGVQAFRWNGTTMTGLGDLPGGSFLSVGNAVSADGLVVTGRSSTTNGTEAFVWTSGGGMVSLGDLGDPMFDETYAEGLAVDADGSTIVGYGTTAAGTEAFLWDPTNGMVSLGDLDGGSTTAVAYAVSADGTVVAGRARNAVGDVAFLWTEATGMQPLDEGDLAGGAVDGVAYGMSADGSVIVGEGMTADGPRAFVWTEAAGIELVSDVAVSSGVDLSGWILQTAWSVSDDGYTIVGTGINPSGVEAAWVLERL